MDVLVLDHFDSFTHNLVQGLGALGASVRVARHDADPARLLSTRLDRLVLSPGPGTPDRTGCASELLGLLDPTVPVLGVCLGMQLLARLDGAEVVPAPEPVHGRASRITHDGLGVFAGLEQSLEAGRYHSLCVRAASLPATWLPTAWAGPVLMGMRHARLPREAVQFHPESVLTPLGGRMLANFLRGRGMQEAGGLVAR